MHKRVCISGWVSPSALVVTLLLFNPTLIDITGAIEDLNDTRTMILEKLAKKKAQGITEEEKEQLKNAGIKQVAGVLYLCIFVV